MARETRMRNGRNKKPGAGLASHDQIADKEKPAMGSSGLKGMFFRSRGNHKCPTVKGM